MENWDTAYLRTREQVERGLAAKAENDAARSVHAELADRYLEKASGLERYAPAAGCDLKAPAHPLVDAGHRPSLQKPGRPENSDTWKPADISSRLPSSRQMVRRDQPKVGA